VELASQKTPERVDVVARNLLGMSEPSSDRILPAGPTPAETSEPLADGRAEAAGDGGTP
jgi:hypothetical protein